MMQLVWWTITFQLIARLRCLRRTRLHRDLVAASNFFDPAWYLDQNPDVPEARIDPISHYLDHGAKEGRNRSAQFNTEWYLYKNPDVRAANVNPLIHYLLFGKNESRPSGTAANVAHSLDATDPVIKVPFLQKSKAEKHIAQRIKSIWHKHRDNRPSAKTSIEPPEKSDRISALPGNLTLHPELTQEPKPQLSVSVSVVIPTYNAGDELRDLIAKLRQQKGLKQIEIIIVDLASTDNTNQIAVESGCKVLKIAQSEFSHSYSRNFGAAKSKCDFILFMVQDAFPVGYYWLYGLVSCLSDQKTNGLVALSCVEYSRSHSELFYDF